MDHVSEKPSMRFLSFSNDKEDAEKEAKLKEAASKIEQAIAREKALGELIDYQVPAEENNVDASNDTRPLYERLLEQKNKKKEVFEESQKLSNFVTKLDEEDVNYLNQVAKNQHEEELKKRLEVYDVLETKKRLDEQKALDEERRKKEFLLGSTLTRKSSPIKSRLSSMIKIKPKGKTTACEGAQGSEKGSKGPDQKAEGKDLSHEGSNKRLNEATPNDQPERAIKKQSVATPNDDVSSVKQEKQIKNHGDPDGHREDNHQEPRDCSCPKDVMKCIGVLPSLPQDRSKIGSSDESDHSDDDFNQRLVPRVGRKK